MVRYKKLFYRSYWDIRLYMLKRKAFVRSGPFEFSVYRNLLTLIKNSEGNKFIDFDSEVLFPDQRGWYVRHDIDMPNCLNQLDKFLDLELTLGIKPACFIRIDSPAYASIDVLPLIKEFSKQGVVFGLHSECYIHDNWKDYFESEIKKFRTYYGFRPQAFNVHGFGHYKLRERECFYKYMTHQKINDYGFSFCDLHNGLREYKYCIQDSNALFPANSLEDYRPERRFLYNDFSTIPPIHKGSRGLVLTHPGYWV
jgi:hypothetical protein